jgi:hypothetical protein
MSQIDRKKIGLYGPHNMWYVTRRSYQNVIADFYAFTYDDNIDPPCDAVKYEILETGTPTEFLTNGREEYERTVATKQLLSMMSPNIPHVIRTFNAISDDTEIISHTHVKIAGSIKSLNELTLDEREKIWSMIYPRVCDITEDNMLKFDSPMDYVFAISSCITPLITNGGIMPHEERLQSTIEQVKSIRSTCPEAKIFLLESSPLNFDDIERLYDHLDYIFLFQKNPVNENLAKCNKSLGESYVIHSLLKRLPPYKLFIKFSGRYKLLNKFKLTNHSLDLPTFRITPKTITWSQLGVCESILYSIPYSCHEKLLNLLQGIINGQLHIDIEHCLYACFCPGDDLTRVHSVNDIYVIGNCSGHPGLYNRV